MVFSQLLVVTELAVFVDLGVTIESMERGLLLSPQLLPVVHQDYCEFI